MTKWNDDRLDELNGLMKDGFSNVDKRFDKVDDRFKEVDKRFDTVDKRFDTVDKRFDAVDKRFVRLEGEMRQGLAEVNREMKDGFTQVNERFDRLYHLILVTVVGLVGTLVAGNVWG